MALSLRMGWTVLMTLTLAVASAFAEEETLQPKGEYANINTAVSTKTLNTLLSGTEEQKNNAIQEVTAAPENYAPVVFCAMSEILLNQDKKDEAAFWYFAGLLRSQYDANRCADVSAREGVSVLAMRYGPAVMQYVLQDSDKWEKLIAEVVEWDRKTPYNYDCRWINLHGMNAVMQSAAGDDQSGKTTEMTLPKDQWEDLAEKTRNDFLEAFHQVIEQTKNSSDPESLQKLLEQLKPDDNEKD